MSPSGPNLAFVEALGRLRDTRMIEHEESKKSKETMRQSMRQHGMPLAPQRFRSKPSSINCL